MGPDLAHADRRMYENRVGDFLGTLYDAARYHPFADRFRLARWKVAFWRRFRPAKFETLKRINLGCGPRRLPGMCNIDIDGPADLRFNLLNRFPIPDSTADLVYCEHTLEHLHIDHVAQVASEVHRILRPRGVFRVSVPMVRLPQDPAPGQGQRDWRIDSFDGATMVGLNRALFGHEHKALYSHALFEHLLRTAGFSEVARVAEGQSRWLPPESVTRLEHRTRGNVVVEGRK